MFNDNDYVDGYQAESGQSNWCLTQYPVADREGYTVVRIESKEGDN